MPELERLWCRYFARIIRKGRKEWSRWLHIEPIRRVATPVAALIYDPATTSMYCRKNASSCTTRRLQQQLATALKRDTELSATCSCKCPRLDGVKQAGSDPPPALGYEKHSSIILQRRQRNPPKTKAQKRKHKNQTPPVTVAPSASCGASVMIDWLVECHDVKTSPNRNRALLGGLQEERKRGPHPNSANPSPRATSDVHGQQVSIKLYTPCVSSTAYRLHPLGMD